MGAARHERFPEPAGPVLTLVSTLVALSVLILIHELGHFLAAKSVDIAAPTFSLGLGPRVTGFKWGETDFVISAIPLGGYVKMAGMEDDEAMEVLEGGERAPEVDPARTFDAKPLWARTWVISAGVIMNLLFALVANIVLAAGQGEGYVATRRLAPMYELGGIAAQVRPIPVGAEVVSVAGQPVANWDEMQEKLGAAPAGAVQLGLRDAAPVTLALPTPGPSRDSIRAALRAYSPPVFAVVLPDGAAAKAGLRSNDRIVAIDGQPIAAWHQAVERFRNSPGKPVKVDVQRGAERLSLTLTPAPEEETANGRKRMVGKIGAMELPTLQYRKMGIAAAVTHGWHQTVAMVELLVTTLRDLVTGKLSPRNLGGLLSIGEASGQSAEQGAWSFLSFLALLSVNLAVLNLLPIPILDGGHLMFLLVEAVRGRPLSVEARIRLSHVGLIIVVGLMLWANGNDVVRYVERFISR
jgi:regulator of sigma E protease